MSLLLEKTKIVNIGPLQNVELKFQGPGVYVITGKNNAGKTHALLALKYLLEPFPKGEENPLRNGEQAGEVFAWLGEGNGNGLVVIDKPERETQYKYKLSRRFTPSGAGQVKCEYAGLGELKKPREILDKFLSDMKTLDPWAFIQMDDKEQVNTLLKIVKIPLDRDRLAQIVGFNSEVVWPTSDLECIDQLTHKLYMMRTDTNRYLEKAKAVAGEIVIPLEWEKAKYVKFDVLMEERRQLEFKERANNKEVETLVDLKKDREGKIEDINKSIKLEGDKIREKETMIAHYRNLIACLEQDIQIIRSDEETRRGIIKSDIEKLAKDIDGQQMIVNKIEAEPVSYKEIDKKIKDADETNMWAGQIKKKRAQEAEVDKLSKESIDLTLKMTRITEYKKDLLSKTKFPCEGLGFEDGKVTLKGTPFKKQGQAEQLIAAFEILRAQNPELRVVLSFSETQMDEDHSKLLEELAVKNGFQFLTCKVREEKTDGCFFIENGVNG